MANERFDGGFHELASILSGFPEATAIIRGDDKHPLLAGIVLFFSTPFGTMVAAEIKGLPERQDCESSVFGFHIHEGESCQSVGSPFSETGGHYNPKNCPHPAHAGDMPPLISSKGGYAVSVFLSSEFLLADIIGKTVVIHAEADDFHTQPSGAAGEKIGCGIIERT